MTRRSPAKPLYRKIFDHLAHDIETGRYGPGQRFPSEAALVKRFGASRITVGHAMQELQQRGMVDRIAGSGTYVRQVRRDSRRTLLFGLIIPNLGETEIFEPICQAIAASPEAEGHALLWPHAGIGTTKEQQALQLCDQCIARKVSGVFFAPLEMTPNSSEVNARVMKRLEVAAIPVVLLDRRSDAGAPRKRADLVGIDNHRAGYIATEHLLAHGCQSIGFIRYEGQASTVDARIGGYENALGRAEPRVLTLAPGARIDLPAEAMECDAFVCANDRLAGLTMQALLARGVRIPRDVALVGIDDVNYASLLPVPLTTVHQPCAEIGETALRVMLDRLDRPKSPARDVLLDCELVIRESCGAHNS